jgi:hypothetical protein
MVFRDTFTQYGGVTVLLQAAALKLFGPRLLVLKLQTAFTYGLAFTVLWRAWSRIMPSILAALVCIVGAFLGPDSIASSLPWSSVFAILFQALALLFSLRYFERGRDRELVFAGAAAALTFWCRQPVGVFLFGGMFVALTLIVMHLGPTYAGAAPSFSVRTYLRQNRLGRIASMVILFGGGFLLVNALIFGWLAWYGALNHWWLQSIKFAVVFNRVVGNDNALLNVLNCLFPASADKRVWLFLAVIVAIQAMRSTTQFLDPSKSARSVYAAKVFLVATVAATSWLQYYPIPCDYHCYWAGIPMFGVFAFIFFGSHESRSRITRAVVAAAVFCLIFYLDVKARIDAVEPHIASQKVTITSIPTLRGMKVNSADAINYDALQTIIDGYSDIHPDGSIVTTTSQALFPTLMVHQASFHPLHIVEPNLESLYPEAAAARAEFIRDKLPMIIGPGVVPPTHVYAGHITWQGVGYNILVPKDAAPKEILECNAGGGCDRRPLVLPAS